MNPIHHVGASRNSRQQSYGKAPKTRLSTSILGHIRAKAPGPRGEQAYRALRGVRAGALWYGSGECEGDHRAWLALAWATENPWSSRCEASACERSAMGSLFRCAGSGSICRVTWSSCGAVTTGTHIDSWATHRACTAWWHSPRLTTLRSGTQRRWRAPSWVARNARSVPRIDWQRSGNMCAR